MATLSGIPPLLSIGPPLLVFAAAVILYPRLDIDDLLPETDSDQLAALTIGITATYLGALLAFGIAWFGTGIRATLLAVGFGLLGAALGARFPATATTRTLLEGTIGGLLAYAASNVLIVTTTTAISFTNAIFVSLLGVLAALPAVLILPLGHADATNTQLRTAIRVVTIAAPLLLAAPAVASADGTTTTNYPLLLGGYLLVIALPGVFLHWTGRGLARGAVR